ncbi:outer membrane protein assembly factor BamB family protein [Dictyobacter kobayashii]|uniref:Pyrrolo-quinoline quinone repeat domain-containing protein n=1 Tax=Dictyobacter kobayashii TaxID=2014872 RepID=A0A402ALI2_9CHLR|nr:PQQ-binding-like beta-propeller repeat protein [Dictyobacter kobayashii]GCE19986.1 hypothetical protein KDK_37860 [Dictyobacter kobayashii]
MFGAIVFVCASGAGLILLRAAWGTTHHYRFYPLHYWCISLVCLLALVLAGCDRGGVATPPVSSNSTPATTKTSDALSSASHTWDDWFTYHHDATHSGYLPGTPDPQQLVQAWKTKLDGAVYAEPLVVKGHLIVATEGDTLYSLDPQTGKVNWQTNAGTPVQRSTLPCGDIDPLGITGTPVYDPATGIIFAVAEISGPQHILVGINADSGKVQMRRVVDVDGMDPTVHQQRSALAVSNGLVYIAYGGLAGDCGNYRGTVVAARTDGHGSLLSYRVPTAREGGIWTTPGPSIDAAGNVFVSVGNGAATSGDWDHSDSVLRLSPQLKLEDAFAPSNWQQENSSDADLGSMGPMLLPNNQVFIAGKSGNGYVLHANALGGVGGQISETNICDGQAMGGGSLVGSQILVPCNDGVRLLTVGSDGHLSIDWHMADMKLPAIVGGHTVYGLDTGGTLYAVDLATGKLRTSISLSEGVPHFTTPTLSGRSLFIGTNEGVDAVSFK